jgi:hypothetical protein
MKKFLLFAVPAFIFFSCSSSSPKEKAEQFIRALHKSDFTTATTLSSSQTKEILNKADKQVTHSLTPEETFQLPALTETVSGNSAEVKNNLITVPLVKEDGDWKVQVNEQLVNNIQQREEMLSAVKAKWEALVKEYEGRTNIAKEYVAYKKTTGALSPQVKALGDMLNTMPAAGEWTGEKVLAYVQKQQALSKALDNALEPSMAANTDLTMNYIMQVSSAGDRIKLAEQAYQPVAVKAQSKVFVPLPFKAAAQTAENR